MNEEQLKNKILSEAKEGNICFEMDNIIYTNPLDAFINQTTDGILYDLELLPEVILSLLAPGWINRYAAMLVIKKLKDLVDKNEI